MRALMLSVIAMPLALAALPAWAQSNPSADEIIQALKPGGNVRGIKLANPNATSSSTAAAPATAPAAAATNAAPSLSLHVEFATNSSELTPQARQSLDQLGRALTSNELGQFHFRIEGHTDTVGSAPYNKALSQRRADAVAAYLEHKFGVAPARLQPVGLGEDGLLVPTPPQTANAQNRRVKVVNLDG